MTQEQVNSLIRHIISVVGGIFIAKGIIDSSVLEYGLAAIGVIVSIVWSIKEKTFQLGQVEGVVRQLLTAVGGYLVYKGILDPSQVETWLAAISSILAAILGQTDKLWASATPVAK